MHTPTAIKQPDSQFLFQVNDTARKLIFVGGAVMCFTPFVSPAMALFMGIAIAQCTGHPYLHLNHKATQWLLQASVVGLGFGMNVHSALHAGKAGFLFTVASIFSTLTLGYLLGKGLRIEKKSSYLISAGTAICGGSAIAAIAPVIKAEEKQISLSLSCIFILNAVALVVFPVIGRSFHLSQTQFGVWCAVAIHDTSSVVGAAGKYGPQALEIATTVKLARALWIIPVAFLSTFIFKHKTRKISIPYFIGWFVVAMVVNTYVPAIGFMSGYVVALAKAGLTFTLFLIGAGLTRSILTSVGFKPLLQGVLLWLGISGCTLYAVMHWL